ncbi:MAG TPA: SIMPL domain-containing protein [Pirellulales bacterium]
MRLLWAVVGIAMACFAHGSMAIAQTIPTALDGITVTGSGEAMVRPNRLEIGVKAAVSAELTADAVVKYRDTLKRTKETIEKLKIDHLEVADRGVNVANLGPATQQNGNMVFVNQQGGMQGNNGMPPKQEVAISKTLRVTIQGIDKLQEEDVIALVAKLLDVAKDAGLSVSGANTNGATGADGQPLPDALVQFVADDLVIARKEATDKAFQQAKEKAQHIADLAGVRLGAAAAVEELSSVGGNSDESGTEDVQSAIYSLVGGPAEGLGHIQSNSLGEMPLRVNLRVRFPLEPKGDKK